MGSVLELAVRGKGVAAVCPGLKMLGAEGRLEGENQLL